LGICTALAPLCALAADRSILVLGDSLSAAYGIEAKQGWVALLDERLSSQGYGYKVVNASVSGETSDGGLARLPRALSLHHPQIVILELGANDGLRGLPVDATRANLSKMIELAQAGGARVLLLGIKIPPNYGPKYADAFADIFPQLAQERHVALVPFLLQDVALVPGLMQDDGLHPKAVGEPRVLDTVWRSLQPLLQGRR
jgi:acyl-CoA thioesterase-1